MFCRVEFHSVNGRLCVCVLVDHRTYVLTDVWVHRLRDETDVCKLNCTLETRFVSQVSPITCTPLQTPTCILKNEHMMPPPPPPTITHAQDVLEQTRHLPTAYLSQPPAQPLGASASLIPKLKMKRPLCFVSDTGSFPANSRVQQQTLFWNFLHLLIPSSTMGWLRSGGSIKL